MTNAITAPPNTYDFGYDFNYALWTEGTVVTLVNVPWNNDYRDIVKFTDRAALNAYINSIQNVGIVVNNVSYIKPNMPVRLDVPFNAAYKFNYLRAQNPVQPVPNDVIKDYYYFITDVRYIAPNTTEFVLQLDVWQTFGFDATFGQCYIDRGHIGIANTKNFNNYGRDYLTIPEGIDVGAEYQILTKRNIPIMANSSTQDAPGTTQDDTDSRFNVLVCSTVDFGTGPGTVNAPNLSSATGGKYFTLPSGAAYWLWKDTGSFSRWLTAQSAFPWMTQGIVSITLIPQITRYFPIFAWAANDLPTPAYQGRLQSLPHIVLAAWRNSQTFQDHIGARYVHLRKFFTYPYMVIEITTFSGSPLVVKPESWLDPDATIIERINPLPPDQRISFSPFKYNALPGSGTDSLYPMEGDIDYGQPVPPNTGDDNGDYLDFSTYIQNFPTIAIVNNMAINYLAANTHGLAFQFKSADWSQQRSLAGNQVSYDQSSGAMNLANQLTGISNSAMNAQNTVQNNKIFGEALVNTGQQVVGGIGNALGGNPGAIVGGLANAIGGNLNAMLAMNANIDSTNIAMSAARRSTGAQIGQAGYMRDTNKSLADWAAKGDYQNTIAGISAKIQDSALTQPSVSGQVGGDAMNLVNNNTILSVRWKMMDPANIRAVGEYWLRYGYAVHNFVVPPASLMVMAKFTYWKMLETYIFATTMPENMKQIIRGIFEKGVTVWANPADIGVTDMADNDPLPNITLP